ncbi:zinc finger protein 2-like isoform X2 [Anthonomus grandis grandis]|uniref:zinc finger protein 2-like isoform X2 n=1 Tax=Anthonomus grandis grandis TaxID=2921223 RepID=UPI002166A5C9|nr:zinc finger protein 2-like isoform X2 [Anthonomus grandis grandis]
MAASSVSTESPENSNGETLENYENVAFGAPEDQPEVVHVDLSVKCRGCFAEEPEMHFLFTNFDQDLSLADILMQTTSFEIQYQKTEIYIRNLLGKPSASPMEYITLTGGDDLMEEETPVFNDDLAMHNRDGRDKKFSTEEVQPSKKCSECKNLFTLETFKAHWETHKINNCPECDYKTVKKPDLELHMQTRHSEERKFVCTQCGFRFKSKQLLRRHERRHLNLRNYCCETCGMRFNDLGPLKTHIKLKHIGTREFICSVCGLDFPLKATLDKHILRHNKNRPAPYNCTECSMRFQDKCSMLRHKRVKHSGQFVRPMCHHCGKTYCSITKLNYHVERHHGDTPPAFKQRGRKPQGYLEFTKESTDGEEEFVSDEWAEHSEEEHEENVEDGYSMIKRREGEMIRQLQKQRAIDSEDTITDPQSELEEAVS